jgi:hypothetical protein
MLHDVFILGLQLDFPLTFNVVVLKYAAYFTTIEIRPWMTTRVLLGSRYKKKQGSLPSLLLLLLTKRRRLLDPRHRRHLPLQPSRFQKRLLRISPFHGVYT